MSDYAKLTEKQKQARRDYYREYHKRPDRLEKRKIKWRKDAQARRDKIRTLLLTAKTTPCKDCGVQLPPEVMEFDHVRGEKTINLSQASRSGSYLSWDKLQEEIEKCDIRCPNCHRMRHHLLRQD